MQGAKPLIVRLREAVWPAHQRLEQASPMAAVVQGTATKQEYAAALAALYGVVEPLEQNIQRFLDAQYPGEPALAPYSTGHWRRSALLEQDLRQLLESSSPMADVPFCDSLPRISTLDQALGMLYVLEGSRLGGQVIAESVQRHLGLDSATGCAYFSGNGQDPLPVWRHFKSLLEEQATQSQAVIDAATSCFTTLETWFGGGCRANEPVCNDR